MEQCWGFINYYNQVRYECVENDELPDKIYGRRQPVSHSLHLGVQRDIKYSSALTSNSSKAFSISVEGSAMQ